MNHPTFDIPDHTLLRKLGEGGVGAVWLATDNILERQVAVKVLKPGISQEEENMRRFQAEALTLAKLRHPNVTMLYNLVRDKGCWYMMMEYVEGETFESLLKVRGVLPVDEVLSIAIQTLEGLQHAHGRGVIHRDLKPSNLMLSAEGEVKIMDFGIARIAGRSRLTRTGQAVGTPQYMSPEQVRGQEGDHLSDIYSFGIVLYELLTGTTPFDSGSEFEIMQSHTSRKPVPPASLNPDIPEALNNAVLKALSKEPSQRFESAVEFKQRLLQIGEQIGEQPAGTPLSLQKIFSLLSRFRRRLPEIPASWKLPINHQYRTGIGFLTLSVLAACLLLFRNDPPEQPGAFPDESVSDGQNPLIETEPDINMETIMQSRPEQAMPAQNLPVSPPADKKRDLNPPLPKQKNKVKDSKPEKPPSSQENRSKQKPAEDVPPAPQRETPTRVMTPEPARTTEGKLAVIPRGAQIKLVLDDPYTYDSAPDRAQVTLSVAEAFERSGITVVAPGAKAFALLYRNTRKRELEIRMLEVESVTGKRLKALNTTYKAPSFRQGEPFKMMLEYDRFAY
jgi:serine/threonine-protein kinase